MPLITNSDDAIIYFAEPVSYNLRGKILADKSRIRAARYTNTELIMDEEDTTQQHSGTITSQAELDELYGVPLKRSLTKEIGYISEHYQAFIEKAPFVVVATSGPEGLDSSPRGDPPGFVRVIDSKTVALPDRPGNNRLDSLRNIIRDSRISLLFLIPGIRETLRINGRAKISVEPELLETFKIKGKVPKSVLIVTAENVYFQCSKALVRSRLWDADTQIPRSALPSTGEILERLTEGEFDGAEYDRNYPEHLKRSLY